MVVQRVKRPTLDDLGLPIGKKVRLHRILYEHGPGHGMALILPIDQGIEHGPVDFFTNPDSADPEYQLRLCAEGGYSAIAFHYGPASKYMRPYAGRVPLILKINGKTNIPPDSAPLSGLTATVEDAVRLGADAVGYTLYVGSPRQDEDIRQCMEVRRACDALGMPLIVWSYPRGEAIDRKGGRDSLYAVDYAARVACELGADVVKLNVPEFDDKAAASPAPYNTLRLEYRAAVEKVVRSAGRTLVLFSGGSRIGDGDLLEKARHCMEAGATGLIFGRNMWQRPIADALRVTSEIKRIMLETAR
jgi:class I fructose-bisphosphate aldolase